MIIPSGTFRKESVLTVTVTTSTQFELKCEFKDWTDQIVSSSGKVFGAAIELTDYKDAQLPVDGTFYPDLQSSVVNCVLETSAPDAVMGWTRNKAPVTDGEVLGVTTQTNLVSLTAKEITPDSDGVFTCTATALGTSMTASVSLVNVGVKLSGVTDTTITQAGDVTLTCTVSSGETVSEISWTLNNNLVDRLERPPRETAYLNKQMQSELTVTPAVEAATTKMVTLEYKCHVTVGPRGVPDAGVPSVVLILQFPLVSPLTVVAVEDHWELTCKVYTAQLLQVEWYKGGDLLGSISKSDMDPLRIKSNNIEKRSTDLQTGPKPGEEDYVSSPGAYSLSQVGNEFILSSTGASYKDDGEYKCVLVVSQSVSPESVARVEVRVAQSPQPSTQAVWGQASLECVVYSTLAPAGSQWTLDNILPALQDGVTFLPTPGQNMYKTVYSSSSPVDGSYSCQFLYADNNNPQLDTTVELVNLDIGPGPILVKARDKLELLATIKTTESSIKQMYWKHGGTDHQVSTKKKVDGNTGITTLTCTVTISTATAGTYTFVFVTGDNSEITLQKSIEVVILPQDEETYIYNAGEAQVLTAVYTGTIAPTSVSWTYEGGAVSDSWAAPVTELFGSGTQKSVMSSNSALTVTDSGAYTAVFSVMGTQSEIVFNVKVRTITQSLTGQHVLYAPQGYKPGTDVVWQISFTVNSQNLDYQRTLRKTDGTTISSYSSQTEERDLLVQIYTYHFEFSNDKVPEDFVFKFEAKWKDEPLLKSEEVSLVARFLFPHEVSAANRVGIESGENTKKELTCVYAGTEKISQESWLLDGEPVPSAASSSRMVIGAGANTRLELLLKGYTWEYGGDYTCMVTLDTGVTVDSTYGTLPVIERPSDTCITSDQNTISLNCAFKSKVTLTANKLSWKKIKSTIDASETQVIPHDSISGVISTSYEVPFDSAPRIRYTCQYYSLSETMLVKTDQDVMFARLVVSASTGAPYITFSMVTLTCEVQAGWFKSLQFLKDGKEVLQSKKKDNFGEGNTHTEELTVSAETAGSYTCSGRTENTCPTGNIVVVSAAISVALIDPVFEVQPVDVTVDTGESATFRATFTKLDERIKTDFAVVSVLQSEVVRVADKSERTEVDGNVEINVVISSGQLAGLEDGGPFYIEATVKLGSSGQAVTIKSSEAVLVIRKFKDVETAYAVLGAAGLVSCSYLGNQNEEITIATEDGGDTSNAVVTMSYSSPNRVSVSKATVAFSGVTEENRGKYRCSVKDTTYRSDLVALKVFSISVDDAAKWVHIGDPQHLIAHVSTSSDGTAAVQADLFQKTVTWQKNSGSWEDDSTGVADQTWTLEYKFTQKQDTSLSWRARVEFQAESPPGFPGGTLFSPAISLLVQGITEIDITIGAVAWVGEKFTVTCSITWNSDRPPNFESTLDPELRESVEYRDNKWVYERVLTLEQTSHSGKLVECKWNTGIKWVTETQQLPVVKWDCGTSPDTPNSVQTETTTDEKVSVSIVCNSGYSENTIRECNYLTGKGKWTNLDKSCTKTTKRFIQTIKFPTNGSFGDWFTCGDDDVKKVVVQNLNNQEDNQDGEPKCGLRSLGFACTQAVPPTCEIAFDSTECSTECSTCSTECSTECSTSVVKWAMIGTSDISKEEFGADALKLLNIKYPNDDDWARCGTPERRRRRNAHFEKSFQSIHPRTAQQIEVQGFSGEVQQIEGRYLDTGLSGEVQIDTDSEQSGLEQSHYRQLEQWNSGDSPAEEHSKEDSTAEEHSKEEFTRDILVILTGVLFAVTVFIVLKIVIRRVYSRKDYL